MLYIPVAPFFYEFPIDRTVYTIESGAPFAHGWGTWENPFGAEKVHTQDTEASRWVHGVDVIDGVAYRWSVSCMIEIVSVSTMHDAYPIDQFDWHNLVLDDASMERLVNLAYHSVVRPGFVEFSETLNEHNEDHHLALVSLSGLTGNWINAKLGPAGIETECSDPKIPRL